MLAKRTTIREALNDPKLLGNALPGYSWRAWRILLIAAMGEALSDEERAIFTAFTGRDCEPGAQVDEFWGIAGRRSGKTRAAGTLAAYVATLCNHEYLASGERASIPIMAASQVQANKAFQAVLGVLEDSPVLTKQIESSNSETIRLRSRVDIEVRPANYRTIRGITSPLAIGDEVAFWSTDEGAANSDADILNAVRPALATSGGLLWVISSPWAKRGELYETFKASYGAEGDPAILVAKGASREFNETLPQKVVARAFARDSVRAASEYAGEFADGVTNLLDRVVVEAATDRGVIERPPELGIRYVAFADPAGGSGQDSFTLAIAHVEHDRAIIDVVAERRPKFSPDAVIADDFAPLLGRYGITSITTDRYAAEFNRDAWRRAGIDPKPSSLTASELFASLVPTINSGQVRLTENARLTQQLCGLERYASGGGREKIGHPRGKHDDIANSVAGAVYLALRKPIQRFALAGVKVLMDERSFEYF
ncbi:hypothetical protein IG197_27395 [Aminobacter sp. SR38]|jgi:hypothetical protein|uniref:hypothetical protein n=1 Tax=Aminobacter sp. SR38 TaxID=2774562 RepID=UPI0017864CF3|nr:hypothetical protein [Aminobacter sp. SR38]QOF71427.1 hypothetical protein IG197_27395 [Aminobacter sp. SR38]